MTCPTTWPTPPGPRAASCRENTSHCFEGATLAAAALRANGYPALIFDLEAEHDTDHVVAIYRSHGHWGAIAKSNYTGCRYREPVYRTLRELALSYFDVYFNLRRERSLRTFSRPVNLARFDRQNWMTTDEPLWFIAELSLHHPPLPLAAPRHEQAPAPPRRPLLSRRLSGSRRKIIHQI